MDPFPPRHLLAISGSLRSASSNSLLLEAVARIARPHFVVEPYDDLGRLPHFNPDLDVEPADRLVGLLRSRVEAADGVIVSCPEYAHGVPGSLKNALDWLVSGIEIVAKPVVLFNASPRSVHAQASLAETLRTMAAAVLTDPAIDVPVAGRGLDLAGLLADPTVVAPIRSALDLLSRTIAAQ